MVGIRRIAGVTRLPLHPTCWSRCGVSVTLGRRGLCLLWHSWRHLLVRGWHWHAGSTDRHSLRGVQCRLGMKGNITVSPRLTLTNVTSFFFNSEVVYLNFFFLDNSIHTILSLWWYF